MLELIYRNAPFGKKNLYLLINYFLKRTGISFITRTRYGFKIYTNTTDFIQRAVFNFGVWEPDVSAAISKMLKPGDLFVDVGANIGYYTLLASKIVGRTGEVISIEAHPNIFRLLNKNVELNSVDNVTTINIAVSDLEKEIEFFTGPQKSLGESTTVSKRGFTSIGKVAAKPITHIISHDKLRKISLIKIDIEGAEAEVLRDIMSNIELFPKDLKIICEIASESEDRNYIFDTLKSHGFLAYAVHNDYSETYYFNWTAGKVPVRISEIPLEQCDIIFSRNDISGLIGSNRKN
ncbi:FkbM family methyltransferase [Methylobacterium sp. J-026]|uniref:FkbM family methyltransferase n=1 Tax=Methylobacterium sp. J-026 TaxID=2836624 RepID=UPI001FBAC9C1|nr:FkbM family methyltransferase [Methylobacterium sp. J-026]MCJ2134409.1 FkbM family methyltransferase [Methylobacterium sp. J-026]